MVFLEHGKIGGGYISGTSWAEAFGDSQEQTLFKIFCCAQVNPGRFIHMFTGLFCEEENAISENRKTCIGEKGWE